MKFDLTPQDLEEIRAFIEEGKKDCLYNDVCKRFMYSYEQFCELQRKALLEMSSQMKSMKRQIERLKRKTALPESEGIESSSIDSVDVANCLMYCLQQNETKNLTQTKFMCILYEAYCSWLGSKKQQLFSEQPVAGEFGPLFWRIKKRYVKICEPKKRDAWTTMTSINPGIAEFIQNVANKYHDWPFANLKARLINEGPFKKYVLRKGESGKYREIPDKDIYEWRNMGKA